MDRNSPDDKSTAAGKSRITPFADKPDIPEPLALPIEAFAPKKAKDEIVPAKGVDLSGQAKIVFVIGRGKTGKTTLLRWMAEQALDAGRPFLMADIDPTNASFSSYFPDVSHPSDYDPVEVRGWLQRFISYAVEQRTTAIIDLGGGDTVLRSLLIEMPCVLAEIEAAGLVPVSLTMCGPQVDDLAPIATLASHGFSPAVRAIVFNEGIAEPGSARLQSFAEAIRHPIVKEEIKAGALVLWMPRLFAAAAVENRRSSFTSARDGTTTVPTNLFDRARVRTWLEVMQNRFAGVASWLP